MCYLPIVSRFSRRIAWEHTPNRIAEAAAQAAAAGRAPIDLTVSNPTHAGIPYASDEIVSALSSNDVLAYDPQPFGLTQARAAVAESIGARADRVVLTASTSEAYSWLFKLLCEPGDAVLVPEPSYPLFELLAGLEAVRIAPYRLAYDGEWHVDLDSVRRAIAADGRARAIVVVNPNNPTGSYLKGAELGALLATGLPVISDEVFARYPFGADTTRVETVLWAEDGLVFALGGLSKLAGLPQLKLGWIAAAGRDTLVREALERLELIADCYLSVGTPVQLAAPRLLATAPVARDAIAARTRRNLDALRAAVNERSVATLLRVEGGWYATLRLPRTRSEEDWVLSLIRAGALVQPGYFYDFREEAFVVLSLLTPERDFDEGVARLLALVSEDAHAQP